MMQRTVALTPAGTGAGVELELGRNRFGSQEVQIVGVLLIGPDGSRASELEAGDPLTVRLVVAAPAGVPPGLLASVSIHRLSDGIKCSDATTSDADIPMEELGERGELVLSYEQLDLEPGRYALEVGLWAADWRYAYDLHERAYPLRIVGQRQGEGVLRTRHRWELSTPGSGSELGAAGSASGT